MLIDRPDTKIAAARHGYACTITARQKRAEQIVRGAHIPRKLIGDNRLDNMCCVDLHSSPVKHLHRRAKRPQNLKKHLDIADIGDVLNHTLALCQNCCGNNCNSSVFCPADCDFAIEMCFTLNNKLFQHDRLFSAPVNPIICKTPRLSAR